MVNRNYLDLVGAMRRIAFGLVIGAFTFGLVGMVGIATAHADDIPYEDGGTPKTEADWDDLQRRAQALQDAYCLAFPEKCKEPEPEVEPEPDPYDGIQEMIDEVKQDLDELNCTINELGECIDHLDDSIKDAQDKAKEVEDLLNQNHYPTGDSTPNAPTNSGDPSSAAPSTGSSNSESTFNPNSSSPVDANTKGEMTDLIGKLQSGVRDGATTNDDQTVNVDSRATVDAAPHGGTGINIASGENIQLGLPEEEDVVFGLPPVISDHAEYIRSMFVEYAGIQLEVFPFIRSAFNCIAEPCDEPAVMPATGKFELTLIETGDKLKFDAVISGDLRAGGYRFDQLSMSGKDIFAGMRIVLNNPDAAIAIQSIQIEDGAVRFHVSVDHILGYQAVFHLDGSIDHMLAPEQVEVLTTVMVPTEVTVEEAVTSIEYVWENQPIETPQTTWRNVWRDMSGNIARNADGSISDNQPMVVNIENSGYWNWTPDYYTYTSYVTNWVPTETIYDDGNGNIYVSTEWSYQNVPYEYTMYTGSHSEWVATTQEVMVPDQNYSMQWTEITENVLTDNWVYAAKEVVTMTPVTKTVEVPTEVMVMTTQLVTLYPPTDDKLEAELLGIPPTVNPDDEPVATTNAGDLSALDARFAIERDQAAQSAGAGSATFTGEMAEEPQKNPLQQTS